MALISSKNKMDRETFELFTSMLYLKQSVDKVEEILRKEQREHVLRTIDKEEKEVDNNYE
jgi:hypothetical protein